MDLWGEIRETMDLLDTALLEAKRRGDAMVLAEAAYYTEKARAALALKDAGHAVGMVNSMLKGQPDVSEKMREFHAAQVMYKNAAEAVNVYKLRLRVLEAQYEREWSQAGRM